MRAVVIEGSSEDRRLVIGDAPEPRPGPDDLLVAVRAISLNHGEVRLALHESPLERRAARDLTTVIQSPQRSWREIDAVARHFLDRRFIGKALLAVD